MKCRAVLVILPAALVLSVAAWLQPASEGMGTHTQLGLPPCSPVFGLPCPTCGITTAFAHAVRGQWLSSISAQPLGALLAAATMLVLLISVWELISGCGIRINWYRIPPRRVVIGLSLMVIAAWIYKIVVTRGQMG